MNAQEFKADKADTLRTVVDGRIDIYIHEDDVYKLMEAYAKFKYPTYGITCEHCNNSDIDVTELTCMTCGERHYF